MSGRFSGKVVPLFGKINAVAPPRTNSLYEFFVAAHTPQADEFLRERFSIRLRTELYDNHGVLRKVWPIAFETLVRLHEIEQGNKAFGFNFYQRLAGLGRTLARHIFSDQMASPLPDHRGDRGRNGKKQKPKK